MKKSLLASLVVVMILVGIFYVSTLNLGNQEEAFVKELKEIGTEFYEDFYYDQIVAEKNEEEIEEFLGRFTDIGIKVDLDNLSRFDEGKYADLPEKFVNKKHDIACDTHNTRAIIYPQAPFAKTDFIVDAELDCGFEEADED